MQAGRVFNVNSPKQLGEVLFETLGLPHEKKTKTGYSTNAEILERLRPYHPIIQDILAGTGDSKNQVVVENRVQAIQYAMDIGQKDDIIVLAGKGHETYQEICGVKHHMDEREIVAQFL